MKTRRLFRFTLAALALGAVSVPGSAEACGGTFCDTGPTAMPVDQTGENILFVMSPNLVEAHIQIQYQGAPERFAWVIPVQALPEFEVGSQILFNNLLAGTVPSFGFTTTRDDCGDSKRGAPTAGGFGAGGSGGTSGGDNGGPQVVKKQTVGAFDVTVLQGGTAAEVSSWLAANGYQQVDTAPALLEHYVNAGHLFVAIKLVGGAGVDEIHPIVIRYAGSRPCVPLKLTSVAAVEDMGVRTFFLGSGRVVPALYKHVTLNSVRIDWLNFGQNYNQVVSRAADSPVADGHAFVTEYAGPSNVVQSGSLFDARWDASRFQDIAPSLVVDELTVQGLLQCSGGTCFYNHPLVKPLLETYLPRPAGIAEDAFYSCLSCYADRIDVAAWNASKFASDFDTRIVRPGAHAAELLQKNAYLTRMFTTISPAEMSLDPEFQLRSDLPNVSLPGMATRRILCDDRNLFKLPSGREVMLPDLNASWPSFSDAMPWAETVEEYPAEGPPIVLLDQRSKVASELGAYNERQGWPGSTDRSCACRAPNSARATNGATLAVAAGLFGLVWRRRRRAR